MSILNKVSTPKHRSLFPGEVRFEPLTCSLVLHYYGDPHVESVNLGDWTLDFQGDTPLILQLNHRTPDGDEITLVRKSEAVLAELVGDELAEELTAYMVEALESGSQESSMYRFADPADYMTLFVNMSRLIATYQQVDFDPDVPRDALSRCWRKSSAGDGSANGQWQWYMYHEAVEGESQAEYAAEMDDFYSFSMLWLGYLRSWDETRVS